MSRESLFLTKAAFFLLGPLAFAQTSVHGTVVDSQGNLPNALVYIENSSQKVTSSTDGSFILNNVQDGSYKLVIEYKGYDTVYIPFNITDKKEVDLGLVKFGAKLKENSIQEVVVTSVYKASQARAITMKKNSNTITEVLSADAIGKLPDRNAADAVQRMQGVSIERDMGEGRFVAVRGTPIQWTASTLNGNRMPSASGDNANRGVQMDIFPSELIQNVRLSKALTPDLDGDAIGGNVDFITKTSPNKETLAISMSSGYVNMSKSPTYNSSIVYGNKITDKLKFISSAVIWERSTAIDQMRNIFNYGLKDKTTSYSINQLQLRDYLANRRTLGFNLGLDYEINSRNKLYFKGLYSQYKDGQSVRETYFNFDNKNVTLQARHADYLTDLYSMQLGEIIRWDSVWR
ncbi:TonB-dependent receptor [Chryseobacterium capnotolerans]|uniref:TonB-dependent receptor n=1 Tax=Chryseobacterium capnotolerans TaxID=2759528 RepID=UPI001E319634|nr:TonB-dependent receptor [Chryseobacterium capnotolerans]